MNDVRKLKSFENILRKQRIEIKFEPESKKPANYFQMKTSTAQVKTHVTKAKFEPVTLAARHNAMHDRKCREAVEAVDRKEGCHVARMVGKD